MNPFIKKQNIESEYFTNELCHIIEVSNSPDDPELSIARARVEPGVTTHWHQLRDTIERYVIQSGCGRVEIADLEPTHVGPGDVVFIPAMCRQRITNTGDNDLVFLAICTPRFRQENYQTLD